MREDRSRMMNPEIDFDKIDLKSDYSRSNKKYDQTSAQKRD